MLPFGLSVRTADLAAIWRHQYVKISFAGQASPWCGVTESVGLLQFSLCCSECLEALPRHQCRAPQGERCGSKTVQIKNMKGGKRKFASGAQLNLTTAKAVFQWRMMNAITFGRAVQLPNLRPVSGSKR